MSGLWNAIMHDQNQLGYVYENHFVHLIGLERKIGRGGMAAAMCSGWLEMKDAEETAHLTRLSSRC